ncbi:MAG: phenylacetate--CoA ligase [Aquificota bacterium]|nr:MAG: phenylacetate--CoA ligase [Aquificota bacterium]RLD99725.1 MAG: phenylacetate--CoA ligase [Aquificota bacterium]
MKWMWNPKFEAMDREELEQIQLERLQATLHHAYRHVPFYRELFDRVGLGPGDILSLQDLREVPFTTKEDLLQGFPYSFFAVPLTKVARIHTSSGTTGKPVVVGYTKRDLQYWAHLNARILMAGGLGERDVLQISFNYGLFTGGFGFHAGAELLGATVIPASAMSITRQINIMMNFKATALVSLPSHALRIGHRLQEMGIDPRGLSLKVGFFGAEPWSEATRKQIEDHLLIKALDNYGLAEVGGPGVSYECEYRQGLHISEDHFYPEIIDPATGEVLDPGQEGELVLTTLTKEAFPVLRFRTGDLTSLNNEPCECGRTLVRMARVKGRVDDMLIIRGINLFPSQIEDVLLSFQVGPNYLIRLYREEGLDQVEVQVESILTGREEKDALAKRIERDLADKLGLEMKVVLVAPGSIEASSGKQQVVVDEREI